MSQNKTNTSAGGHLFTVEILIEEATNGLAMEKLLHLLNVDIVKDYRINKGIDLGKLIEVNTTKERDSSIDFNKKNTTALPASAASVTKQNDAASTKIIEQLESYKLHNTLIRLTVIKAKGIKLSLPCRILNYDNSSQHVTVYHVDEKKVYLFKLNEIDDYVAF
ncbi:hypothetical protein [Paenibacillus sp. N3.4]|uniref:hypothetical protein n=1 Tax=Paenibacillus sp. N3.4 TaxID=2603222 RepID=UPI0011C93C28|nr:hypothetical protein [Paenibacillus sp. N3.4]TXK80047.1 hypothetical protein FU659_18970 [Paenibacillus sp. N3.4]